MRLRLRASDRGFNVGKKIARVSEIGRKSSRDKKRVSRREKSEISNT